MNEPVSTAVNAPMVPKEVMQTLMPYTKLAQGLGAAAIQVAGI